MGSVSKQNSVRKLSFLSIFLLGINAIVGSGTFLLPEEIFNDAGVLWGIICIFLGGIATILIAMCYADLSGRFSGSGAAWLYSYESFGPFVGFEVGLFMWFAGVVTIAAEIAALIRTLKNVFPFLKDDFTSSLCGIILLIILGIINLFGVSIVKWVDNISSGLKLTAVAFFVIVGAFFIHRNNFFPLIPVAMEKNSGLFHHFGQAYSTVFYMFLGFSFLPVAAKKMNNPQKNLPRALIAIMISVSIIYIAVQVVVIGILGNQVGKTGIPVAEAMKKVLGDWAYFIIIVGSSLSIFGVAFSMSFDVPYIASSLSNEHQLLPKFFGRLNKYGAPYISVLLTIILSIVLLLSGDYIFLVSCTVCATFVQYVPVIFASIKLRNSEKYPSQGFKLRGGWLIPSLAFVSACYVLVGFTLKVIFISIVVFVVGIIFYFLEIKRKNNSQKKLDE